MSPPTSPGGEQNLAQKLQKAEERKAGLEQDKMQKLAKMVKEHGGVRGALYQIYWTDDLKVCHRVP